MRWWSRHQRGQNNSYKIKYFIFWSLAVNRRCCGCEAGCPKVVQRIRTLQINWKQDKDWGSALRLNSQRNRERLRWSQRRTKDVKKKRSHMRSYPSKEADPRSHRGAVRGRQEAQEEEQHQPWTGEGGDVGKLLFNISQLCVSLLSVWQRRAATLHPAHSDRPARVSPCTWTACERYMKPQTWGHSCEPISPTWAFLKRVSYYINTSVF